MPVFRQITSISFKTASAVASCGLAASLVVAPIHVAHAAPPDGEEATGEGGEAPLNAGDKLLAEGHELFADGEYEASIEKYEAALAEGAMAKEALAQAHFRLGTVQYQSGEYQSALENFQDAQALFPSPQFFYNIAQCYESLENWEQAINNYKAYLRGSPDARDRANTENKIKRLEKLVELGDKATEADKEAAKAPMPETKPKDKPPGRPLVITGAVLTGVGAAVAIGGGAGFGVQAADRADQVDAVQNGGNPQGLSVKETKALDDEGKQAQTLQIVMISAGAAVGLVGVALLAVGISKNKKAKGKTAVVPTFGPGQGGFAVVGRF